MSTRSPTTTQRKRTWFGMAATLWFAIFAVGPATFFSQADLTCTRSASTCELVTKRLFNPSVMKFPLASFKRAQIETDEDGLTGVAIEVDGKNTLIAGELTTWGAADKLAWVRDVNDYLATPSIDQLSVARGRVWPAYLFVGVAILIIVGYIRSRSRLAIDPTARTLKFERRLFVTEQEAFNLDEIASAGIDEKPDSGTNIRAVALHMQDGSTHILDGHSNARDTDNEEIVAAINEALRPDEHA